MRMQLRHQSTDPVRQYDNLYRRLKRPSTQSPENTECTAYLVYRFYLGKCIGQSHKACRLSKRRLPLRQSTLTRLHIQSSHFCHQLRPCQLHMTRRSSWWRRRIYQLRSSRTGSGLLSSRNLDRQRRFHTKPQRSLRIFQLRNSRTTRPWHRCTFR